jgi:MFS transporter, NNP family, nitrate/nitrite transporter
MQQSENSAGQAQFRLGRAVQGILFLAFLFFLNFLSRILFSPLLPLIKEEFLLNNSRSASLFFFISSGYFISVSMSGFVSAKINHANTILLSSCASGVVLILATYLNSYAPFCLALFVLGLAAGLYLPSGMWTISASVPHSFLARGIAIHELAPNLGFIMAPLLLQSVIAFFTWRQCLIGVACALILTGIVYRISEFPLRSKGVRPDYNLVHRLFVDIRFWQLVFFFSLAICSTLGLYAMLPLFLVSSHGMNVDSANYIVALTRIVSLFTPFIGGWLGDRFGNSRVMTIILISGGGLTIIMGMSSGAALIVLLVLQAMVAVCFFPSGLAMLSSFEVDGKSNVALPFCIPFSFVIGGGVLPFIIGVIGDMTSIGVGITLIGGAILITGIIALFTLCRDTQNQTSHEQIN